MTRYIANRRFEDMDRSTLPLAQVSQHYFTSLRTEGKTPNTLRGYKEKLGRFVRWLNGTVADVTLERSREFVAHLQACEKWSGIAFMPQTGAKLAPQTVANHVRVMKAFASWLYEEGYVSEHPLTRLALPKVPFRVIEVLTPPEVSRLLAAVNQRDDMADRDLAILVLFLDTGLRLSELISLRIEDLHFEAQWLKVMGKGQKERVIPFGARAAQLLTRYVQRGRYDPLGRPELFLGVDGESIGKNTIKMLFNRLRHRSGLVRLHPHLLRHTFATSYLVAGGDVFTLQQILGHTTLEMTRRYVTLASTQVNLQHRRFSPMDQLNTPILRTRLRRPDQTRQEPRRSPQPFSHTPNRSRVPVGSRRRDYR